MATRTTKNKRVAAANAVHSAAIHLLRSVRKEDERSGIGPARLSALSVLVFAGPMRLTKLARIEQVKPPTMTKVVAGLVAEAPDGRDRCQGGESGGDSPGDEAAA